MKALLFDPVKKELSLVEVPQPQISEKDDVIIEVAFSGVCGTDIHIIEGQFPCSSTPIILGHEFSGVVKEIGHQVSHVEVGDRVAVDPQSWCSTCMYCTTGRTHCCPIGGLDSATGIYRNGGWAEFCVVSSKQVYKLPPQLSLKQGALCEPMSCIMWGWERVSPISIGNTILVTGAGIIGNLWSAVLHHHGHRKVTVSEINETRRQINNRLDTGYECLDPSEIQQRHDKDGWSVDVAIDCSGNGKAIQQSLELLKTSGKLCIFGVASPQTRVSISPYEIFRRELTIVGAKLNPFTFTKVIGLMEAMGSRYIDYNKLGIQDFQLDCYKLALQKLKSGDVSKVVFKICKT